MQTMRPQNYSSLLVKMNAAGPSSFFILLLVILPMSAEAPMVPVFMNTCNAHRGW
jgi:hypothetical protein